MAKCKVKKDDMVVVISGADKKKQGKVLEVLKADGKVLVEGVNLRKRAMRRTQDRPQGGIDEVERPIDLSNVMEKGRYEAKAQTRNTDSNKQEASS